MAHKPSAHHILIIVVCSGLNCDSVILTIFTVFLLFTVKTIVVEEEEAVKGAHNGGVRFGTTLPCRLVHHATALIYQRNVDQNSWRMLFSTHRSLFINLHMTIVDV